MMKVRVVGIAVATSPMGDCVRIDSHDAVSAGGFCRFDVA